MKISNLILTFILALFVSFTIQGQTGSNHVISINDDNESIHIEFEDGEVSLLKIDGVTIDKRDYPTYQHLFDKYKKRTKSNYYDSNYTHDKNDIQPILLKKLKAYLSENERFNDTDFEFKLTKKYMKVNGKKLSRTKLNDCLEIFEETAGYSLSRGSYFKVDIAPGSRSVSLSLDN